MTTRIGLSLVLVLALAAVPALAGEYHSGSNLICSDCHTMHASMQHGWNGGPVSTTGAIGGDWLPNQGSPNEYLLKGTSANQLCLSCHNGQTFAPDVFGANTNAAVYTKGREAGGLNDASNPDGYQTWMGHTLGSQLAPPGYDPTLVGLSATWYDGTTDPGGLECISCHAQHGPATSYRNLGAYALGATAASFRPTYNISGTNSDTTKDVWINLASYTAGTGNPANFGPYYDTASIWFNRNDTTINGQTTSNRIDAFCAACHGLFHGGVNDSNVAGTVGTLDGFLRHPNAGVTIGAAAAAGYGGHSDLARFQADTTKVHVVASAADYSDAGPTCLTCHKAHGNQNPFGLVFLNRNATSVNDEGGYTTGQTADTPTGLRNLCGQCHGQGN